MYILLVYYLQTRTHTISKFFQPLRNSNDLFFFADDQFLDEFSGQILEIPAHFADICIQALNTRQEIIVLVKDNMSHNVTMTYITNI